MASATPAPKDAFEVQYEAFRGALPALIERHAGKWIVWFDGPQHVDDEEDAAERWALGHLPRGSDFVLSRAERCEPVPLSGLAPLRITP